MKMQVVAIYDQKSKLFSQPYVYSTVGVAARSWQDAVSDPKSDYARHPEDFSLYLLAVYDDEAGTFVCPPEPEFLVAARSLIGGER